MGVVVAPASPGDLDQIKSLLDSASLPTLGVDEHIETFLVAREGRELVGAIGMEDYGEMALLRSAVVVSDKRNAGIGTMLYNALIERARSRGVRKLVLLTNTADRYFARKGFRVVDRNTVQGPVTQSIEFTEACPSHAFCMEMDL
jgi:amino-acid N-acetyltransferase